MCILSYTHMKNLYFEGSSLDELQALPTRAKQVIGFQLERIQLGKDPVNWKPLNGLGKGITGVREIRVGLMPMYFAQPM